MPQITTWYRRLYFPSEGRCVENFFALKVRGLRPGLNSRTRVPEASMLTPRPPKPPAVFVKKKSIVGRSFIEAMVLEVDSRPGEWTREIGWQLSISHLAVQKKFVTSLKILKLQIQIITTKFATGTDFHGIWYSGIFLKPVEKIHVSLK